MVKNTVRLFFIALLITGVIPVAQATEESENIPARAVPGFMAENWDAPPSLAAECSGTCSNGTGFTCSGATVSCTDGSGCTAWGSQGDVATYSCPQS